MRVYLEALAPERRASGFVTAATLGIRHSWRTGHILYYVWRIQRQQRRGAHAYLNESSLSTLPSEQGLEPRAVERTLAGQCAFEGRPTRARSSMI